MVPALVLPAHHAALLAIPAFAPAIVVVGVILFIAWRDRRDQRRENDGSGEEAS
jgi:ABC-type Fe3+-siderophore transport system permease subunit